MGAYGTTSEAQVVESKFQEAERLYASGRLVEANNKLNEILTIMEHHGTINSLFLLHDGAILSTSADKKMKKISFRNNFKSYNVDFVFNGYNNYILKGIELKSNHKIISCSWDKKILIWEKDESNNKNKKEYLNTDIYTERDRVIDILEISKHECVSLSESELKFWDSSSYDKLYVIKNEKKYIQIIVVLNIFASMK